MSVCAQSSQRATWPPSVAVRQRSMADITLSWSRLTCPALAERQVAPWSRKTFATSSSGRGILLPWMRLITPRSSRRRASPATHDLLSGDNAQTEPPPPLPRSDLVQCRVGSGNCTPSLSQNRTRHSRVIRLVPPLEGCRLPLNIGFLPLPVDPSQMAVTRSLRSTDITPFPRYYGAVRPSPAHRYFRPRGLSHLRLFPSHRHRGSHVPYKSLVELRAAYMPDAAWAVSGHPPS